MRQNGKSKAELLNEVETLNERLRQLEQNQIEHLCIAETLKESEGKWRAFAENAPDFILNIDSDGTIKYINRQPQCVAGEVVPGTSIFDCIPPEHYNNIKETIARVIQTAEPTSYEISGIDPGGTTFWYENRVRAIIHDNKVTALTIFATDITEHKKSEKELQNSREQLRNLSTHLQSLRENERKMIAREIHDELGMSLAALKMDLSWLKIKLPPNKNDVVKKIVSMSNLIDSTTSSMQNICTSLRPGILDELDLVAAIEWQAETFQNRSGIECHVSIEPEEITINQDISTTAFRIIQEAMTNVFRHAEATKVKLNLQKNNSTLTLSIHDNGIGIAEEKISHPSSLGLIGIRERALLWGGEVIISSRPYKGTSIEVQIPIE